MVAIPFKVMFVDTCFLSSQICLTDGVPPKDRRRNKSLKIPSTCTSPLKSFLKGSKNDLKERQRGFCHIDLRVNYRHIVWYQIIGAESASLSY